MTFGLQPTNCPSILCATRLIGGASLRSKVDFRDPKPTWRIKKKKKKESIFDLSKYIDKPIRVKFQGGREASGVLKGFDPLLNLVLDGTIEYMRDPDDQLKLTEDTRQLAWWSAGGTSVVLICPQDGMEAIPNPFIQQQDG
ncbi:LOW QUALITY PROTEIN: U6 snRNA-associated Sm-like protein LSm7 [Syngnathus acus]|uniref:LOW QUALITY PROTEIN: U6 snRNA-associated Sm-like protein LSm7 n=1 Tax=Syngnathus acus TaxID=161584 RepID=UPI001885BE41|nr:LOW QUALITY PROTEIN: U6 snRNA-associated Sm-like protein LSm7 [Syngnathus acus]